MARTAKNRPWSEVRKRAVKRADEPHIARERAAIETALALAQLRRRRRTTQADLATKLQVSQSSISQLERGKDVHLSTVANYVHGLGGRLEINAVFPDGEKLSVCAIDEAEKRNGHRRTPA